MKSRLVWLGVAAFLLALLIVLPVRWVAGLLPPQLHCKAWSGSVWRGQCTALTVQQPGQQPLLVDQLSWKLHPAALLRLALRADFDVRTAQGNGTGLAELGRNGHLVLEGVSANAVFDRRLATMLSPGWTGQLSAQSLAVRLQGNQLQALSGNIILRDFSDGRGGALGSYQLQLPPAGAPPFVGTLKDMGGPLEVTASLTIEADRRWRLAGSMAPRPGTAPSLLRNLDILGGPDASGRYPLTMEGAFR